MTRVVHLHASQRVSRMAKNGKDGIDGINGKDAVNINLSPSEFVYNTDEKGNIPQEQFSGNNSLCTITATRGSKELPISISVPSVDNCVAYLNSNTIRITKIRTKDIEGITVPASAGGVNIRVIADGIAYNTYLPFRVNTDVFEGTVLRDNKKFQQDYKQILDSKASMSEVGQTARKISLEVSSQVVSRRNLLVNSDFHNQESLHFEPGTRIECTTGKDGINCVHANGSYSGSGKGSYIGVFWDGSKTSTPSRSIKIEKGKKYVVSCWVKCDNMNATLCMEGIYTDKQQGATRKNGLFYEDINVSNVNAWELYTLVVNIPADATYEYLAVNFWMNPKKAGEGVAVNAWFCKPMFEQSEMYSGWSLSEEDSDYVGGNMLDDTRMLLASAKSNLLIAKDVTAGAYEGEYAVAHGKADESNNNMCDFLRWNGEYGRVLNLGQDKNYVFSFLAKGNGVLTAYMYKDSVHATIYSENSQGFVKQSSADGVSNITLTSQWKRYWVHWRIEPYTGEGETVLPRNVLLRAANGCEAWVCKPKLEEGALMTEYTERKTDLVDKASLKKAGIEILSEQVTLYGNKVQIKNPKENPSEGYDEAAMFENGKLNAKFINAGKVVADGIKTQKLEAQNLHITGESTFSGKMKAVSGSFRELKCVNAQGNSAGSIMFDNNRIYIDGDLYSQGYNYNKRRPLRFYASDVWCRGNFGHSGKTIAVVHGNSMRVYTKGVYNNGEEAPGLLIYLTSKVAADGVTKYYEIPLYSPGNGNDNYADASGMPIDIVVFNITKNDEMRYAFTGMDPGKEWRVINANDKYNDLKIADTSSWTQVKGGCNTSYVYIPPTFLSNPTPQEGEVGAGVFHSDIFDMNW